MKSGYWIGAIIIATTALSTFAFVSKSEPISLQNNPTKMKVEIWSDVACPFCYIGKKRFEQALSTYPETQNVEVIWKSYILTPELITDASKTLYQSLSDTKGWSPEQARSAGENVSRMAALTGLEYRMDRVIPANTSRAHALLQAAKEYGKGSALKERLLKAYFIDGLNIDDETVLKKLALESGLTELEAASAWKESKFRDAVQADLHEAEEMGVTGVPYFVFDRKFALSGAQEVSVFAQALSEMTKRAAPAVHD